MPTFLIYTVYYTVYIYIYTVYIYNIIFQFDVMSRSFETRVDM